MNPQIWAQRRIWRPQVLPSIDVETVTANRLAAGASEYALNCSMVQIWQKDDQTLRYALGWAIEPESLMDEMPENDPDYLLEGRPVWHTKAKAV